MRRKIAAIMLSCMTLLAAGGCGSNPEPPPTTASSVSTTTASPTDTQSPTDAVPTEPADPQLTNESAIDENVSVVLGDGTKINFMSTHLSDLFDAGFTLGKTGSEDGAVTPYSVLPAYSRTVYSMEICKEGKVYAVVEVVNIGDTDIVISDGLVYYAYLTFDDNYAASRSTASVLPQNVRKGMKYGDIYSALGSPEMFEVVRYDDGPIHQLLVESGAYKYCFSFDAGTGLLSSATVQADTTLYV